MTKKTENTSVSHERRATSDVRIGVYVCHCGSNIAQNVNVSAVVEFASKLEGVVIAREHQYMCSDPGQSMIENDIKEHNLNRIVVSSCSPLMHEITFRHRCEDAGLNQFFFQMANIREQCSWVALDKDSATDKAKRLIRAAVYRVALHEPLEFRKVPVNPASLVVGGGIAGIEAARVLAGGKNKVYLVEKTPTIGGHMAKFDKTFPTLDCSACILTPKMVSVGNNENIELLENSEVEEVKGYVGNFHVRIKRKARFVDLDKCTSCGECEKVCPIDVPDDFNEGMSVRHAIYRPFPQAVPNAYVIEKRATSPCRLACPVIQDVPGYLALIRARKFKEAMDLIRRDNPLPVVCGRACYHPCQSICERSHVDDPIAIKHLKRFVTDYAMNPENPGTDHERGLSPQSGDCPRGDSGDRSRSDLSPSHSDKSGDRSRSDLSPSHSENPGTDHAFCLPCSAGGQGDLSPSHSNKSGDRSRSDLSPKHSGKKIAIIGAGPAGLAAAWSLAKKGYKPVVFEAMPKAGGMCYACIPAYRLPKNLLEKDINYIRDMGVEIKTGVKIGKDKPLKELLGEFDATLLAIGTHEGTTMSVAGENLKGVIQGTEFLRRINMGEDVFVGEKVAIIGGGNTAIDASRMALRMGAKEITIVYRRTGKEMPADVFEIREAAEEGIKMKFLTLPTAFAERVAEMTEEGGRVETMAVPTALKGTEGKLKHMICIRMELGEPDASGRRRPIPVKGSEFTIDVDQVILAIGLKPKLDFLQFPPHLSSSPSRGEELKEGVIKLTPWGTIEANEATGATNIPGLFAAGDAVTGPTTIVESMGHGKRVAEAIHFHLEGKDLKDFKYEPSDPKALERKDYLSPKWKHDYSNVPHTLRVKIPQRPVIERVGTESEVNLPYSEDQAVAEAGRCLECGVCVQCYQCVEACKPGAINHDMKDEIQEIDVGNIILSTGFKLIDAKKLKSYGYGVYDNVITSLEFERLSHAGGPTGGKILMKNGKAPKSIAILHCIGSRDEHHNEYCSRVCCMYSLKMAHLIKEKTDAEVFDLYIDMRSAGKGYEEFYKRVLKEGVIFIRGKGAEVTNYSTDPDNKGKLIVSCEDTLLGIPRKIPVDMVVLSLGLTPAEDSDKIVRTFRVSKGKDGFFLERHPKLAPVSTASDGIFIAGTCQGPKDIPDTVAQAGAAAAQVAAMVSSGHVMLEPTTASIDEKVCTGCRTCITLCPYDAISTENPGTDDKRGLSPQFGDCPRGDSGDRSRSDLSPSHSEKVAVINEVLCKGCGTCVAACPSGAAMQKGFNDTQIFAEIEGLLQ